MSFHHASVSKTLMLSCVTTSIIASIFDVKHYFHVQLVPHLSRHYQYWRLFAHHLTPSNSSDLLLTELLLYNTAVPIERLFGSVKFSSFFVVTICTSIVLEYAALVLFNNLGLNYLPSGPTSLVFSILYQSLKLIPSAYNFRLFGVTLSNKVFMYIVAWQLFISQPPGSIVLSFIGLFIGQLYHSDDFGLKRFRIPSAVHRFSSIYLSPLIGSTRPSRHSNRALPHDRVLHHPEEATEGITTAIREGDRSAVVENAPNGNTTSPSVVREWVDELTGRNPGAALRMPSDDEVTQLVNMFPHLRRNTIMQALQRSANIGNAVETLLTSANL